MKIYAKTSMWWHLMSIWRWWANDLSGVLSICSWRMKKVGHWRYYFWTGTPTKWSIQCLFLQHIAQFTRPSTLNHRFYGQLWSVIYWSFAWSKQFNSYSFSRNVEPWRSPMRMKDVKTSSNPNLWFTLGSQHYPTLAADPVRSRWHVLEERLA